MVGREKVEKPPYDERSDADKLKANWVKAKKLFERRDFSACVVRIATAAEIAANIYVRKFLIGEHGLPSSFVYALLVSANGLDGKYKRLIRPAAEIKNTWKDLKSLQRKIQALHDHRNGVVHTGKFKTSSDAKVAFDEGLAIIKGLAPDESQKLTVPSLGSKSTSAKEKKDHSSERTQD